MEGNKIKNKPRALLLFGAPCSGKTTFAEKFANKFALAHYDLDKLAAEHNFTREVLLIILAEILKTKQNIIVEGGLDTEKDRAEIRNLLRSHGYEPSLIWVQTDMATIRLRLKSRLRSVSKAKKTYDAAVAAMETPSDIEHPIILSGKHTFETQTKHVITGLADLGENK